ncbi:MAG: hypothetical protein HZA50_13400 [Planctomycetes bacterium]|nr:hypothetical protein [Planctomycetota bacterium]
MRKTLLIAMAVAVITAIICQKEATMCQQTRPASQPYTFDPASLKPFTDGGKYLDKYVTGLYPDGKNEIPAEHLKAGQRIAATIKPLDADGKVDEANGKILALVMGHSNCQMYFMALNQQIKANSGQLNPRFELLNAAVGGQQMPQLRELKGAVWDKAAQLTSAPGYSAKQVQILFLHTTYHGAKNRPIRPPGAFPETMQQMQKDMATVLEHCVKTYPNLKIAYLTCDGFRHFSNFEPHVWQEAFAFKWLIESQIKGEAGTAFEDKDGKARPLPWLQWGPYIWDNTWDKSYFRDDGVHPIAKATDIFVKKYWSFLIADPVAKTWLWKDGKPPAAAPK